MLEKYFIYANLFCIMIIILIPVVIIISALSRTAKSNRERRTRYFREMEAWQNRQNELRYADNVRRAADAAAYKAANVKIEQEQLLRQGDGNMNVSIQTKVAREPIKAVIEDDTDYYDGYVDDTSSEDVKCLSCTGTLTFREGKYGAFYGCSNYPECKQTVSMKEFAWLYFKQHGINIYSWNRKCPKCSANTAVYTYLLKFDLGRHGVSYPLPEVGIGDIDVLDNYLSSIIPTIKIKYSRTTQSSYMANTCIHCSSLQGRHYVVDDPHEVMHDLCSDDMDKYIFKNISVGTAGITREKLFEVMGF